MAKDLNYYAALPYRISLYQSPEGGFVAEIVDLPGCLSQGDTADEAVAMINDARLCWLASALEHGDNIPEPAGALKYGGKVALRIPADMHRRIAERAARDGVSINTELVALLAEGLGATKAA